LGQKTGGARVCSPAKVQKFQRKIFNTPPLYAKLDPQFSLIHAILPQDPKLCGGNMAEGTNFNMEGEFTGLDFHSVWLEERFVMTMKTLIRQPDTSI
jgi:hypothetical protein